MPSINVLLPFLVTTAIFAFIPGPAMLYAAAQTLSGGRPAGLMAALGIHIGCYAHIIAAAAGLSVLFHAVPTLYLAVKLAGAAYLIWLGVSLFSSSGPTVAGEIQSTPKAGRRAFFESITVEVLNPKTAIFSWRFFRNLLMQPRHSPYGFNSRFWDSRSMQCSLWRMSSAYFLQNSSSQGR